MGYYGFLVRESIHTISSFISLNSLKKVNQNVTFYYEILIFKPDEL